MPVQGIFNSRALATSTPNLTALSFDKMITRLMPNGTAPLFALTSYLNSETAVAVEHGYFAKGALFPFCVITLAATSTATQLQVDSTENFVEGMVLRINNSVGENVLVEAIIGDNSLQVRRGFGGTAGAIVGITTPAFMVGNAYEEASLRPAALNVTPRRITNLTQIFRNSWAISGTATATNVIAGDSVTSEGKQDCAAMHAQAIEASLFFGKKFEGVRKGQPIRTMDGVIAIVSDLANYPTSYTSPNVFVAGATTNYTQLEGFLDPSFNQTTDPKAVSYTHLRAHET
jgi:hypothetical protein